MKKFRGTLILALIVLVIGGLAITEFKKAKEEETTAPLKDDLFQGVTSGDVTEAEVKYSATNILLSKNGETWTVKWTGEDIGDASAIESFISSVISQEVVAVDVAGDPKWEQYGLSQPSGFVRLKRADGRELKVEMGSRSYDEGFYARRTGESTLLVAKKDLETYLQKSANDFRTRKLQIPEGELTRLELKSGRKGEAGQWTFAKKDGHWVNSKDEKMQLAANSLENFLYDLRELEGSEIVGEDLSPKGLQSLQLHRPEIEVKATIKPSEGEGKTFHLKVSAEKDGQRNYLGSSNKAVLKIAADNGAFKKSLRDFRDRKFPFQVDLSKVESIKMVREKGGKEIALKKSGSDWLEDPVTPGRKITTSAVGEILSEVPQLEAYDLLPMGAKKTAKDFTYLFLNADGTVAFELQFGAAFTANNVEYFVAKASRFDGLIQIEKSKLDALNSKNIFTNEPTPTPAAPQAPTPAPVNPEEKKEK